MYIPFAGLAYYRAIPQRESTHDWLLRDLPCASGSKCALGMVFDDGIEIWDLDDVTEEPEILPIDA
jgi:hypothetical protein